MLAVNGELVAVPHGGDLSQSLVEFIRTQTRFTVSEVVLWHVDIVTHAIGTEPNPTLPLAHMHESARRHVITWAGPLTELLSRLRRARRWRAARADAAPAPSRSPAWILCQARATAYIRASMRTLAAARNNSWQAHGLLERLDATNWAECPTEEHGLTSDDMVRQSH